MPEKKSSLSVILPVMFGFFIMGFVDIIGMTINYCSKDFQHLSPGLIGLLASSCFVWFLVLSVPTGQLMNKIGRKKTVLLSFLVQIFAFGLVMLRYDFVTILVAFSLVGIGNTLLQVAMNPLVSDVVPGEKLTGTLTLGQLIKAVCSLTGPMLVSWFAGEAFGNWKLIFPVYAGISLVGFLWLMLVKVDETPAASGTGFAATFRLLADPYILAFFIGILVLVGVDVGINTTFPKYLQETCGMTLNAAALGNSVYFFARTVGALIGGVLLMKVSESKFFNISVIIALVGLLGLIFLRGKATSLVSVSVFGLGYANLFAIIFSMAMKRLPSRSNEISSLLIMGVAGGGVITPLLGVVSEHLGGQLAALILLTAFWLYLFLLFGKVRATASKKTVD